MAKNNTWKPLSYGEAAAFCGQMYLILGSGISVVEGISILMEDAQNNEERALLSLLYDEVQQTGCLAPALEQTNVFPAYLVKMVRLGEETGSLDEVMHALQTHYEREASLSKSIRSALTYPMLLIAMMFLIILVLITKVMPVFQQVFRQLGKEMTSFSKGILDLGTILTNYAAAFVLLGAVVLAALLFLFQTRSGKKLLMKLSYRLRLFYDYYEKTAACRFADGMYLSLKSGINPEQALEFSDELIENPYFKNKIVSCRKLVAEGTDISRALQEANVFTGMCARLISVAARSGSMDQAMAQIASLYESEVQEKVTGYVARIEPTLVAVLSVIVGVILFSVMLPLLVIMSAL